LCVLFLFHAAFSPSYNRRISPAAGQLLLAQELSCCKQWQMIPARPLFLIRTVVVQFSAAAGRSCRLDAARCGCFSGAVAGRNAKWPSARRSTSASKRHLQPGVYV